MYNLKDIKSIHLEVTSKCQASCPMCARNIQGGIDNPFMTVTEITLEQFKEWFPVTLIQHLDRLFMCGNLGDPIIAKDTLKIFQYLTEVNPNISLGMNTNGSAKSWQFWKELARLNVHVRFGIDGLIDTHSLYRVGTNWLKIIDNAKHFIKAGGEATWDMLVFEHNKHQIDSCKELSEELGFKYFVSKNTARFKEGSLNVIDKQGKTTHILYPTDRSRQIIIPEESKVIKCKVAKEKSLYVSATGNLLPCCWLDNEWFNPNHPHRIDYMDKIGKYPSLHKSTLTEIFDSNYFNKIADTWNVSPLKDCSRQCGEVDRFNEQFK
jgi:MoaA/NifB/PqqE/SkfB family radical SAM enzyme